VQPQPVSKKVVAKQRADLQSWQQQKLAESDLPGQHPPYLVIALAVAYMRVVEENWLAYKNPNLDLLHLARGAGWMLLEKHAELARQVAFAANSSQHFHCRCEYERVKYRSYLDTTKHHSN
jgi:hypothetical protein